MPDADETIITKLIIEADDLIQGAEESRNQIEELKLQLRTLSVEGKQSIADLGKEMLELAEKQRDAIKVPTGEGEFSDKARDDIKEYNSLIKNLRVAIKEAQRDESLYSKQQATSIKEISTLRKQASKAEQDGLKRTRAAQAEYLKVTRQGYGVMSKAAQQYGQRIQKIAQIIRSTAQRSGQSWQQVAQRMARLGIPIKQINTALQQLNAQTKQTASGVSGITTKVSRLGNVGKYVFGTVLGLTAITALRDIGRAIKDAAEAALDFQQKLFAFEISVRALQRVGLETTLDEWYDVLQDIKKEFPIFSKRDITEAAGLAGLMTREFGFSTDQIENTIRASASLSLIWGKDLTESVRGLTYAISAGYFESLQRVGIQISRSIVAQEALRQGYEESYNALDEQIRAAITYDIVMGQVADLTEDTSKLLELEAGQVLALKGNWDDLTVAFGDFLVGAIGGVEGLQSLNDALIDLAAILRILGDETKRQIWWDIFQDIIFGGPTWAFGTEDAEEQARLYQEIIRDLAESGSMFEDIKGVLEEPIRVGGIEFSPEDYQEMIRATQELHEEIVDIEEAALEKRQDIIDDFARDSVKRWKDYQDKLLDLEEDFGRRLIDIDVKAQQRKDDAVTDYGFRVADVARDAAFRREEAERKYRERELKEERKFQEKLRQLRENFLFDLEDAVRERDARQIIRLTRQYNLRRDQMIREEKLSKDDRINAFQEELRQIEFQRQERLRQLAVEHARRLQEIDLQAERERERAKIEFERRQEAEKVRHEQQKEDRKERLGEQLTDLEESTQERTDKIVEGLQKEYDLSDEQLTRIGTLYTNTYGPNGTVDRAIYNTMVRLQQLRAMMMAVARDRRIYEQLLSLGIPIPPNLDLGYDYAGEQAEGGSIIARKPTVAIFGEAGDEMATFTPLNKLDRTSTFGGQSPVGSKDSLMGKLRLEMLLSPDLEARIIDDTLDEVADVIYTVERERR